MDDEQIFFKTPAGDDAVRERTRLVQRNLRMVLILVDGVVDAAALKRKVGDAAMVESALVELNRMGLIETADERAARNAPDDSAPPAALPTDQTAAPSVDESDAIPVLNEVAPAKESVEEISSQSPSIHSQKPAESNYVDYDIRPLGDDRPAVRSPSPSPLASIKAWWQSRQRRRADAQEEALFEKAYVEASADEAPVVSKSSAPQGERKFKLGPVIAVTALATAVLGISRLVFYPYDEYRPEFEQRLSAMLDDTVRIGNVRVGFIPWPIVTLERVRVGGATVYADIEAVRIVPELWTLVGSGHQYQQVVVDGMRIQDAGLTRLGRWFLPAGMGGVQLDKFELTRLSLGLGRGSLDGLTGHAELDEQRGLARLVLRAKEGDFQAEAVPSSAGLSISASATEWKTPFQIPLVISKFELAGRLSPGRFAIDKLEALAYEGLVSGSGMIGWDRDSSMAITLNLQHLAAGKLLPALGAPPVLEGEVGGRLVLGANAPTVNRLEEALRVEGRFQVARGNLKRFDLAGVLRHDDQGTGSMRGGSTAFEDFSGTVASDSRSVRLGGLRLSSGLLQAGGQATVLRQSGALAGSASVELRSSTGTIRAPVGIAGNLADPELRISR